MTLDRRAGRAAEKALGRRSVGQPNRRRARRHHAQRGDRQGPSARACRAAPRAPSSAAPRPRKARSPSHMLRVSRPLDARQHRAGPRLRLRSGGRAGADRQHHPDRPAAHLLELTEETCRWPIGDPGSSEFFFCGGNALTGLPYCAYHSRVAYQPASERRRETTRAAVRPTCPHRVAGVPARSGLEASVETAAMAFQPPCRSGRRASSRRRARCGSGRRSRPRLSALRRRPTCTSTVRSSI